MEILTLSTGRNILKEGSKDRLRMERYAHELDALHIVVLSQKVHGYSGALVHDGTLHIYPTHSVTPFGMLISAWRDARKILLASQGKQITVSPQDPLFLGFLGYLLARSAKAPLSVQVHGDYFSAHWKKGSFFRPLLRFLIRFVLTRARKIRVVSERIKHSLLMQNIPASKIVVLPIRPELEKFQSAVRTRPVDDTFVILTASRLESEKDIQRLVSAFAEMRKSCPGAMLRIVGSGYEKPFLEEHIKACGVTDYTELIPWTEQIEKEMVNADVFALASKHEAYGLVLVEALASGVPVVTTDVGCVGEVVEHEVHGLVVKEGGVEPYARALMRMYTDAELRRSASGAGRVLGRELSNVSQGEYAKKWVAAHT
jgi:glycosyltransferase involved in cell wall biosynthesis